MLKLQIGHKTYLCPTTWAECSLQQAVQLIPYYGLLPTPPSSPLSPNIPRALLEAAIIAWLGCTPRWWAQLQLAPHQWQHLATQLQAMLHSPLQLSIGHSPYGPSIAYGPYTYYLPTYSMSTPTALEVAWLAIALIQLGSHQPGSPEHSQHYTELVAIAARPLRTDINFGQPHPQWNGDPRQPLSAHGVAALVQQQATLPATYKYLIFRYTEHLIATWLDEFAELFEPLPEPKGSISMQPKYPPGFGLEAQLRSIAAEGLYGTYTQVCATNARQLWMYLYQKHLEAVAQANAQILSQSD